MVVNLLDIDHLQKSAIYTIWEMANERSFPALKGNVAWSFEGNGIRTRTTFVQTFQRLRLNFVELPNFLKTSESVEDLAGYMDAYYSIYVIRDSNHQRMKAFSLASERPVINAMTSDAHPCEVLTDACYLHSHFSSIENARVLLWGPSTNVLQSWHALAGTLGLNFDHYCPTENHKQIPGISFIDHPSDHYDVVITDAWPTGFSDASYSLSELKMSKMGNPLLLPTPPVTIGNELLFSPNSYKQFVGYGQKALLLPVQQAIVSYLLMQP